MSKGELIKESSVGSAQTLNVGGKSSEKNEDSDQNVANKRRNSETGVERKEWTGRGKR